MEFRMVFYIEDLICILIDFQRYYTRMYYSHVRSGNKRWQNYAYSMLHVCTDMGTRITAIANDEEKEVDAIEVNTMVQKMQNSYTMVLKYITSETGKSMYETHMKAANMLKKRLATIYWNRQKIKNYKKAVSKALKECP